MIFTIELALTIVALLLFWREDRRRREYEPSKVWSNHIFKLIVAGFTILLTTIFILEDGDQLMSWLIRSGAKELNALFCSVIIVLNAAIMFGTIAYLAIIPDEKPANKVID